MHTHGPVRWEHTVHKRWHKSIAILLLIAALALALPSMCAAAQGELTFAVQAGYDGYYRANAWMPVRVIVSNEGPDIEGQIQVSRGDGTQDITYSQPALLPTHSRKAFTLYVLADPGIRTIDVRLLEGERTLAKETARVQPIGDQDFFYAVVSDDGSALNYLAALPPRGNRRVHVAHLALSDLPLQGRALTAIDMLVLHRPDSSAISAAQRDALRGWVAMGGHLVICGGPNAQATAAGMGDLLPVTLNGSETTSDISELGEYAGIPLVTQVRAVVARVVPATEDAQVLAGAPDRPLLIRRTLDSGHIDYLALDPDLEPMRTWIGNDSLWPKLTFGSTLSERLGQDSGWHNISAALANLSGVAVPSVLLVAGFLVLYVGIVGPLNFLILKWVDKRALAWVTVPILILLFSCAAYLIGFFSRGRKVIVSEVSIVRAHSESQTAVVDSYLGLYSPARRSYDVRLPDRTLARSQSFPYYGMGSVSQDEIAVEQGTPSYLRDLQIDVGEMRTFGMQAVLPWGGVEAELTVTPVGGQYHIEGTITNHTKSTIQDCVLLFESQPVHIPDLDPGGTQSISADIKAGYYLPPYQLVEDLAGYSSLTTKERREQERRREVLYGTFLYAPTPLGGTTRRLEGITLLGWLSASPQPVEVIGASTATHATTMLLAQLPYTPGDADMVLLPLRSLEWQHTGSGHAPSPYEIFRDITDEEFVFRLPSEARGLDIDQLLLHVDTVPEMSYSMVPEIQIRDATTGAWEVHNTLQWGPNEILLPERFVDEEGQIAVKVRTSTVEGIVSVDFSAILRKE